MRRRLRTQPVVGLEAAPDEGSLARLSALTGMAAASVRGYHSVVGVDRGDPAVSFNGPLKAQISPTDAIAAIAAGPRSVYLEPSDYSDAIPTDTALDPYREVLLRKWLGQ